MYSIPAFVALGLAVSFYYLCRRERERTEEFLKILEEKRLSSPIEVRFEGKDQVKIRGYGWIGVLNASVTDEGCIKCVIHRHHFNFSVFFLHGKRNSATPTMGETL